MTYRVELTRSAKKEFDRLAGNIQERCLEAFGFLASNPFSEVLNVKKLRGSEPLYRVRIGDYRIVYEIQNKVLVVIVIKIGHRSDVYRR